MLLPPSGQVHAVEHPDPGTRSSPPLVGTHRYRPEKWWRWPGAGNRPGSPGCRGCRWPSGGRCFGPYSGNLVPQEPGLRASDPPAGRGVRQRPSADSGPRSWDWKPQTACCCSWFHSHSGSCSLEERKTRKIIQQLVISFVLFLFINRSFEDLVVFFLNYISGFWIYF